jgi:acetyl esterase/lipase
LATDPSWKNPDAAYANAAVIPDGNAYADRWQAEAARFRSALGTRAITGLAYGPAARQQFDLFLPSTTPRGLLVFVHGGYWLLFGRESWSHLANGALQRGFACAMPSYTLAPDAPLPAMTAEIVQAVQAAAQRVTGPVVVTGHSAGGHLSARMACADGPPMVRRVVPISPLADLEPLMATAMQEKLQLTSDICASESPARLARRPQVEAHVWVGGDERPVFLWHGRLLAEAWACPWTVAPGRHHFNVIDDLTDPASALMETCLGGL